MADGANGSNGAFGTKPPDTPKPPPQKPIAPDLIKGIVGTAGKGFFGPILKGMGESVRDMLMGPGGRREESREEGKEDFQQKENVLEGERERGENRGDLFQMAGNLISTGQPIPEILVSGMKELGFAQPVIDAMQATAQRNAQQAAQFDKDAQGMGLDPATYMEIKQGLSNPKVAPYMQTLLKANQTMKVTEKRAALTEAVKTFEVTKLGPIKEAQQLGRQEAASRFNEGQREHGMAVQNQYARGREVLGEALREHGGDRKAKQTAGQLKGGALAALKSIDTVLSKVRTGKMSPGDVDSANLTALEANPDMGSVEAMGKMGFVIPGATTAGMFGKGGKPDADAAPIVAKGVDDLFNQSAKAGYIDKDTVNAFLHHFHDAVTSNNEDQAAQLLVQATKNFPPEIRDQLLQSYQRIADATEANRQKMQDAIGADNTPLPGEADLMQPQAGDIDAPEPDDQ